MNSKFWQWRPLLKLGLAILNEIFEQVIFPRLRLIVDIFLVLRYKVSINHMS